MELPNTSAMYEDKPAGYQRQQDVFATLENGLSLDVTFTPSAVQSVKDFFAQSGNDFQAFSGQHPYVAIW